MDAPFKVALVASSLGRAGAEKQFCYMARSLREAGVDARVFHLGAGGHYADHLSQLQIPYHKVRRPGHRGSILIELTREMVRFRPHVVLASQFGDISYAGIAGRIAGSFVVAGIRSSGARDIAMFGWRGPWMTRLAHAFIANSAGAKANLESLGIKPEKIAVLPNVIDLNAHDHAAPLPNPAPGRILAIAVGRMHSNKRFEWFIDALATARRTVPELAGMIVGGDEGEQNALQEQARQLGLGPRDLIFFGECASVPSLLRHARMLVLTSRQEGFPNVILEAMSTRIPVITTPAGEAPLLVQHGKAGYVANSVSEIATHMASLAKSADLGQELGTAARLHVERQFQYPCLAPRLLSIVRGFAVNQQVPRLAKALRPASVFQGASVCELLAWVSRS